MAKRRRDEDGDSAEPSTKRPRPSAIDRLSRLSDELTLRILSYLPVSQLIVCERLSHKFQHLASDSQIWKQLYYERFVRPRASRLPGPKDTKHGYTDPKVASHRSRWLDDEYLVKQGTRTNWKRQYKLRHNWTSGSCAVDEIEVAEEPSVPPILVQMHGGVIYMADQADGLRAWSAKERRTVAQTPPSTSPQPPPTCLAVDTTLGSDESVSRVMVGFEDGSFTLYGLREDDPSFLHLYTHAASSNGVLSAAAISWPYAVTMTATQRLSLYEFKHAPLAGDNRHALDAPRLLHSLRSHTVWPPLSTSLRTSDNDLTICIAYAVPTYLSGWTVGIQEVKLSRDGALQGSRLASAIDHHYRPLAFSMPPLTPHLSAAPESSATPSYLELTHIHTKPTSLSYTHPYLLVSHPDNTLTLYLVTSMAESLSISAGSRLWGHTSSVSGAHVGGRGKAVSVSKRGDELRVWELEGGFGSSAAKKRLATGSLSVQIRPAAGSHDGTQNLGGIGQALARRRMSGCAAESSRSDEVDLTLTRGWIGFDDEKVVLLKEKSQGAQALVLYDFT